MWIKNSVNGLIDKYQTRNVYKLIDYLNIDLEIKELPHNLKGQFQRDLVGNEKIYLSNRLNEHEKIIVLAHELGHAVLHTRLNLSYYTKYSYASKNKFEQQANKFAAELLIPDMSEIRKDYTDNLTFNNIICIYGVPKEYVKLKFNL